MDSTHPDTQGSGKLLVITNETGGTVTGVEMRLKGKAVGGMFGDPNWSFKRDSLPPGGGVQAPFRAAWGANTDSPRIEIEWTSPDGDRWQTVLDDLPI